MSPSFFERGPERHDQSIARKIERAVISPSRDRFDFSTIMGIKVDSLDLSAEAEEEANVYLAQLKKDQTNSASLAELAFAFRRQLQTDLSSVRGDETNITQNDSHAFSIAIYRKLLSNPSVTKTLRTELTRHQKEKDEINGTYEEFKSLERRLDEERDKLIKLLSDMFRLMGQESKPGDFAKRVVLESKVADLEEKLELVKAKNPDVAALIEYDTLKEYAHQSQTTGFIWTKSRRKLLQDVLTGALTKRPVVAMMGETGTGKTAIARAASLELADKEPLRTVGGDSEKFVRLLASPTMDEGRSYYLYGPLLRAMTGKSSSIDDTPSKAGGIFFDDEFNTRPTSVQRQILKFVSECRVGRSVTIPGTPLTVTVEPGFLYLAAGNPPSDRYDREETGIETKREFAGNVINVEYLEQTKDNPELYQVLLCSLLDEQTGRLTVVTKQEVEPRFLKDSATGEYTLADDPSTHGFLYRFANCWGELNKAFSRQDTVLHKVSPGQPKATFHLTSFILDAGVVLSWMDHYKKTPKDRKKHLGVYLTEKFHDYLLQFPPEEQTLVKKYLEYFNLNEQNILSGKTDESVKPKAKVLTPKEIGYLNPNVKRPKDKTAPPKFDAIDFRDPDTGEVTFLYVEQEVEGIQPGTRLTLKDKQEAALSEPVTLLGLVYDTTTKQADQTKVLLKNADGTPHIVSPKQLVDWFEIVVPPTPETGKPFAYDKKKANEYGFCELKIERHEKAQKIIDAVYARDPAFVTLHQAGTEDPDSTTNPKAQFKTDTYRLNTNTLKDAWIKNCPNLPNTPEKSLRFFEALMDHRLSNTIDSDDPKNLNNPKIPHVPQFGKDEFILVMDFPEFNYINPDKQSALTPATKKILKKLFNTEDPTSIPRNEINTVLWSDHDKRVQSDEAKQVVKELLGSSGSDPNDFELRLMRYDEYARSADTQNYGKKSHCTHFDGYWTRDDGYLYGLSGGDRCDGGVAYIGYDHRDTRNGSLVVRFVLSRKS